MHINLPSSKPQANVASYLEQFRKLYLQQALPAAIQSVDLQELNRELYALAPSQDLKKLAGKGIRGEFIFASPIILATKPNLLGYYRLFLGYSQKEFYQKSRLARFQKMEAEGKLPEKLKDELEPLCLALNGKASELIELSDSNSEEFADFRDRLVSKVGILSAADEKRRR